MSINIFNEKNLILWLNKQFREEFCTKLKQIFNCNHNTNIKPLIFIEQWRRQDFIPDRADLRHIILLKGQYIIPKV